MTSYTCRHRRARTGSRATRNWYPSSGGSRGEHTPGAPGRQWRPPARPADCPPRRHRARPHRHPRPPVRAARPRPDAGRPGRPHQRLDRRRSSPRARAAPSCRCVAAAGAGSTSARPPRQRPSSRSGIPALLTGTGPGDVMASLGGGSLGRQRRQLGRPASRARAKRSPSAGSARPARDPDARPAAVAAVQLRRPPGQSARSAGGAGPAARHTPPLGSPPRPPR